VHNIADAADQGVGEGGGQVGREALRVVVLGDDGAAHILIVQADGGGLVAYVVGFAAMIPFLSTTFYVGPAAEAMNGADISFIVGLVVSGGLYLIVCRGLDLDAEQAAIMASDRELEQRESAPAP